MSEKYYLLSSKYGHHCIGTVLKYDGKKIYDFHKKIDFKYDKSITKNWIEISFGEACYLLARDIDARINLNRKGIFNRIFNLNINDECYYLYDKNKFRCTILARNFQLNKLSYLVESQYGSSLTVTAEQIELFDDDENKLASTVSGTRAASNDPIVKNEEFGDQAYERRGSTGSNTQNSSINLSVQGSSHHDFANAGSFNHSDNEGDADQNSESNDGTKSNIEDKTSDSPCHDTRDADDQASIYYSMPNTISDSQSNATSDTQSIATSDSQSSDEYSTANQDSDQKYSDTPSSVTQSSDLDEYSHTISQRGSHKKLSGNEASDNDPPVNQGILITVRCKKNNINIVNVKNIQTIDKGEKCDKMLLLKQGQVSMVVILKWKGKINGQMCIGIVLDKDCDCGTNGTFKCGQLFECSDRRGVLLVVDDELKCCESGTSGASAEGMGHTDIVIATNTFIDATSVCCAERKDKFESARSISIDSKIILGENNLGTVKWIGMINGTECIGVEMDKSVMGTNGTFNGLKLFDCPNQNGVLFRIKDIAKTLWIDQIKLDIHNPSFIQSIKPHRNISKYLVYRRGSEQFHLKMIWRGMVDDELCVGCVLNTDIVYGTDSRFMDHKWFECADKRGILIKVKGFCEQCVSDTIHNQIMTANIVAIKEDSICCVQSTKEKFNIPTKQPIIVDICGKKRLVKCEWTGRVNGADTVGLEMDSIQTSGTNGSFCKLRLFTCEMGMGLLYKYQDIKYVPNITFINDIYLSNDYELPSVKKDRISNCIGKTFQVQDNLSLHGKYQFSMVLFNEKLMAIEIDEDQLKKTNDSLVNILFDDDINQSKYAIVKENSAQLFTEELRYVGDSGVVDYDSVTLTGEYQSEQFSNDDHVTYQLDNEHHRAIIIDAHLLNNVPCFQVWNKTVNNTLYIREDAVTKLSPNTTTSALDTDDVPTENSEKIMHNDSLENIPCDDDISRGKYAIVKENSAQLFTEELRYVGDSGVVDYDSVTLNGEYQSEHFFNNDNVTYQLDNEHHRAIIIDAKSLNNVRCLQVWDITIDKTLYIREDVVTKLSPNTIIAALVTDDLHTDNSEKIKDTNEGTILNSDLSPTNLNTEGSINSPRINDAEKNFFNNTFLKIEFDMASIDRSKIRDFYGKHVIVRGNPNLIGKVWFITPFNNEYLVAIEIDRDTITKIRGISGDIKIYDEGTGGKSVIIVRLIQTNLRYDPIEYINESNIIDMKSIKSNEDFESRRFKNNDIVRYDAGNGSGVCYGRIVAFKLLNDVQCVEVMNTIEVSGHTDAVYLREAVVTFITVDKSKTKYIEDTIIDPTSIVTYKLSSDEDLEDNDEVEFTMKDSRQICHGNIRRISEVNGEICAIVELSDVPVDGIISQYKLNDIDHFKDVCKSTKVVVIVRGSPTIRKRFHTCNITKVPILNPAYVTDVENINTEAKVIKFKSKGEIIVARLLWYGRINNQRFIGCEMKQETIFGTNGTFGDNKLFDCSGCKGVLIPLDKIEECCVDGSHMKLIEEHDGRIMESSICCVKILEQLTDNPDIKLGKKVVHVSNIGKTLGTCQWIGMANGVQIIGLHLTQCHNDWLDQWTETLALSNDPLHKIGLFISSKFTLADDDNFLKDIFFKNELDLRNVDKHTDLGKLVTVQDHPDICGRVFFRSKWIDETLIGIKVDDTYLQEHNDAFKDIRLYKNDDGCLSIIIIREKYSQPFQETIKYIRRSNIIDMTSIKVREHCEPNQIKKDAIVRYDNGNESGVCYGRIVTFTLLNGVRCVEVMNTIEVSGHTDAVYLREAVVTVIIDYKSKTKYIEDTIIDPTSIVTYKLSSDEDLEDNDEVEFTMKDTRQICHGNIRQISEVNGEICAIVEFSDVPVDGIISQYKLNNIDHFKDVCEFTKVVVIVRGPPTIRKRFLTCNITNVPILNPANVTDVKEIRTEDKVIKFKSKGEIIVARLLWYGRINNHKFIGCEMKQETRYGTNGMFGANKLFDCSYGKGVLIPLDKIAECCVDETDVKLVNSRDGRIIGSSICCAKTLNQLSDKLNFELGDEVGNTEGIHGTCRWIGWVNNVEMIGLETLDRRHEDRLYEMINKMQLFHDPHNKIELFVLKEFTLAEDVYFFEKNFFQKEVDLTTVDRKNGVCRLVTVRDRRDIYGREIFIVPWKKYRLIAIRIDRDYLADNDDTFKNIRLYRIGTEKPFILVKSSSVCSFDEPLTYIKDSGIVDKDSIKIREHYESRRYNIGDIVSYDTENGKCYGRIVSLKLLNNTPCVEVVNTIEVPGFYNNAVYIREDRVTLTIVDKSVTKYIDDTIINPASIVTYKLSSDEDLSENDEVEFTMKGTKTKYQGTIRLIVEVNGEICAIVELFGVLEDINVQQSTINDRETFNKIYQSAHAAVIVRGYPTTRKKFLTCNNTNVPILNPETVDLFDEFVTEDKVIVFKSNGSVIVARLRCRGRINNQKFIGCEMKQETRYGTNGIFGDNKLFDCSYGKGVLIPLDKIEECCVNGSHIKLCESRDGRIIGSSICCARRLEQLRDKSNIKLREKVIKIKDSGHIQGACRWIGLLNDKEVIGVESEQRHDDWVDDVIDKLEWFDNSLKNIGLFDEVGFYRVDVINFYKNIFYKNEVDATSTIRMVGIGKLVQVQGHRGTYGRVMFQTLFNNELMTAIEIDGDYLREHDDTFKHIKLHKTEKGDQSFLVALSRYVHDFKEPIKYRPRSAIIDMDSIKVTERCESKRLKIDNIVIYENEDETCYGRIVSFKLLNDIPCVGVVNSIEIPGNNDVVYIREDKEAMAAVDKSMTNYIEDTIIDPMSIITFKQARDGDLNDNDEVEFTMPHTHIKCHGNIRLIAEVNGEISAIVELSDQRIDPNIAKYRINNNRYFKNLFPFTNVAVVVKGSPTIRKRFLTCNITHVTIFNPGNVDDVDKIFSENKVIIFKCNEEIIVARLLWYGRINSQRFIGCEMKQETIFGTNGTFGDNKLFNCSDGKGVLIPLDKIEECCVNGSHTELSTSRGGRIIGSSICCTEKSDQFSDKLNFKIGDRLKTMDQKGKIFGKCQWKGLVNKKAVIGVEMPPCFDNADDELVNKVIYFDCSNNKITLFTPDEFTEDYSGLSYCYTNNVCFVGTKNNVYVDDGYELLNKMMKYKDERGNVIINMKWRGKVNGELCVGCEMERECQCGMDGVIKDNISFQCTPGRGFLIPVTRLVDSCEHVRHLIELDELSAGDRFGFHKVVTRGDGGVIDPDSICCVEKRSKIDMKSSIKIGSKLKYKSDFHCSKTIGNCKWMGLINGIESIGVNMKDNVNSDTTGLFSGFNIFTIKNGRGALIMTDIIEHDIEGEKLPLLVDQFVDVTNLWKVKNIINEDTRGMTVGDYVRTRLKIGDVDQVLNGELKWMGVINNVECVGIDLEDECGYGMNGVINVKHRFKCPPRHGVVTTMRNAFKNEPLCDVSFTDDGMVNVDRYMKCEEHWDDAYLRDRKVEKDGPIFIIINNDRGRLRKKGTLRWSGTMNGVSVAVAELRDDYINGTNGRFWRQRLIECDNKRAVAVPWHNVHEYIPYEVREIPTEERLFKEISCNSAVIYYDNQNDVLKPFYGTVKWIGVNDYDEYLYGIELDDRLGRGTDGRFDGQILFHCQNHYGILVGIHQVAPDVRFIIKEATDDEIPRSQKSEVCQYAMPTKEWLGENRGIQGNANSCYFDSSIFALFSKSDVLDFMISPKTNENEGDLNTKEFRETMSGKIVWPLREFGFVSFHNTLDMRNIIKGYGPKFEEMTKQETDMENVAALLAKLCPNEQLLRLLSLNNNITNVGMFLQLFVVLDNRMEYISSQQMLEISMAQNEIIFDEPPTCLIMQAPRDARGINCYDKVLPSRVMEISQLCNKFYKKCKEKECEKVAEWQCRKCLENTLEIREALFCEEHKCQHDEITHIPDSSLGSHSHVQMHLKAIICIEKAHFVSYVKEDEFDNKWIFFDSMSTQHIANNYSVPKVTSEEIVTRFLSKDEDAMRMELEDHMRGELKRIVKDSYIFVYHNTSKTCY